MKAIEEVKDLIRNPYCFPGGYAKVLVMADGEYLCADCAKENFKLIVAATKYGARDGWQALGCDVNWEDPDCYCANCNKHLPCEYGDD